MEAIVKHLNELSTFQSNLMAQSEVLGKRQIDFARKQFGDEVKSAMEGTSFPHTLSYFDATHIPLPKGQQTEEGSGRTA